MRRQEYACRIATLCLGVFLHASAATAADNTSPVARWEFGTEEATPLRAYGNVQRDQAGPRPPEFPDMAANNTAVRVDASAYLSVPDQGSNSDFDFANGDAITIEAWVNPLCPSRRSGQLCRWQRPNRLAEVRPRQSKLVVAGGRRKE